jgi:hypothetical protein
MRVAAVLAAALLAASPAQAEDAPICTDRPGKANGTCTVPAGRWQVESSVVDWLRLEAGGSDFEALTIGSTFIKLGVSDRSDLQLGVTPYVRVTSDGDHASGFGDIFVRYKHRLTSENSGVQIAAIPFVKLPTADGDIGNGKAEGGLSVPISFTLAGPISMTLNPEVHWLADGDGHGRHPVIVQVVALSAPVAPRLTLIGDMWASWNYDPDDTIRQASADLAAAFLVSDTVQIDAGANLGLTRDTDDIELYAGASVRF